MIQYIQRFVRWLNYPSWVWVLIAVYFCIPVIFYVILPYFMEKKLRGSRKKKPVLKKKVIIVVLGDLGHSPRMLYHAKNFSDAGYDVELCGYLSSQLPLFITDRMELNTQGTISVNEISVIKTRLPTRVATLAYKVIAQHWLLVKMLFRSEFWDSKYVLVQNPPILPILHVLLFWKYVYSPRSKIIIDWHNLNYSIVQMKFGGSGSKSFVGRLLTTVMRLYEFKLSEKCDLNLTVSLNMKKFLIDKIYDTADKSEEVEAYLNNRFLVLRDRPADQFHVVESDERTKIYQDLVKRIPEISAWKLDDVKILVSSTSFTKDEDFTILLDALKLIDEKHSTKLLVVVTGKGPERQTFFAKLKSLRLKNVVVRNFWFSLEDYGRVISIADLAISLHVSSSGIDLPMKILDFFGAGVPTVSVKFDTITELVKNGVNGFVLAENSEQEMANVIMQCLTDKKIYSTIKQGAVQESQWKWDDNWKKVMAGIL